jgi:hypothetical protein
MSLNLLLYLLPIAFALHNLEEALTMEKWSHANTNRFFKPVKTKQFSTAVALFTVLGFFLVFLRNSYPSERVYLIVMGGFAGMLFLNVFFPHLAAAIALKKYTPGLVSAVLINLPLSLCLLFRIYQLTPLTMNQLMLIIAAGGMAGIVLAWTFLKVGKLF